MNISHILKDCRAWHQRTSWKKELMEATYRYKWWYSQPLTVHKEREAVFQWNRCNDVEAETESEQEINNQIT